MTQDSAMRGQRVLVTGACGFVGTNLVASLVELGADVLACDLPEADWTRLPPEARPHPGDLLVPETLAFGGPFDLVVHLAARTDLDGRTAEDYRVNTDGTRNLIRALANAGGTGRFVHFSTQLVVGLFDEARFIDESEPFRTATPYGQSKIDSELIVGEECPAHGIAYTIIRPTSVYGPWGAAPFREFFRSIRRGRYLHVGRARNLVSLVFVQNLIDLTLLLGRHPDAVGEVFFGNDLYPYTMHEVAETAARHYGVRVRRAPVSLLVVAAYLLGAVKVMGVDVPLYPFRLRNMRMTYCYTMAKSVRLGYLPRYDLASGIRETLEWYDAHPDFSGA